MVYSCSCPQIKQEPQEFLNLQLRNHTCVPTLKIVSEALIMHARMIWLLSLFFSALHQPFLSLSRQYWACVKKKKEKDETVVESYFAWHHIITSRPWYFSDNTGLAQGAHKKSISSAQWKEVVSPQDNTEVWQHFTDMMDQWSSNVQS